MIQISREQMILDIQAAGYHVIYEPKVQLNTHRGIELLSIEEAHTKFFQGIDLYKLQNSKIGK